MNSSRLRSGSDNFFKDLPELTDPNFHFNRVANLNEMASFNFTRSPSKYISSEISCSQPACKKLLGLDLNLPTTQKEHIIIEQIGEGKFGKVYKIKDKDGSMKALKVAEKSGDRAEAEATILGKLSARHANVPKFYGAWRENKRYLIKMEYCDQDLRKTMNKYKTMQKPFPEKFILNLMEDLLQVLCTLHRLKYVHMDIKPGSDCFIL